MLQYTIETEVRHFCMYNILSGSSDSFLDQPWGLALFIIIDVAILVLIIALNYKWCCKRLLDILFSLIGLTVFFPFFFIFLIVQAIYNKKSKAYEALFVKKYCIGKKEKFVYRTEFSCEDREGKVTPLGKVLRAVKIAWYPRLADVFAGRLSLVGPAPLRAADLCCMKEEDRARFLVRPGLISSLEKYGGETLAFSEMFEEDVEYAEKRSLFKDISYFVRYFVVRIRGDKRNRLGEYAEKTYVQSLVDGNTITREEGLAYETQGEEKLEKFLNFKKEKANYLRP